MASLASPSTGNPSSWTTRSFISLSNACSRATSAKSRSLSSASAWFCLLRCFKLAGVRPHCGSSWSLKSLRGVSMACCGSSGGGLTSVQPGIGSCGGDGGAGFGVWSPEVLRVFGREGMEELREEPSCERLPREELVDLVGVEAPGAVSTESIEPARRSEPRPLDRAEELLRAAPTRLDVLLMGSFGGAPDSETRLRTLKDIVILLLASSGGACPAHCFARAFLELPNFT
mmetsp:Transcript_15268/g.27183  ORF Transcript_15268/g.27183 Transcript_15268/m.27183 type:complete len:230 (+) Transcript_15268:882-1571(+)